MQVTIIPFVTLIILATGCFNLPVKESNGKDYDFISKWQSLNDQNSLIEFTDSTYNLYKNQELFLEFDYSIIHKEGDWYDLKLTMRDIDNPGDPIIASIQIVTQKRIRIYFFKHHEILDVADEYYRTDSLDNFENIMKTILKEK